MHVDEAHLGAKLSLSAPFRAMGQVDFRRVNAARHANATLKAQQMARWELSARQKCCPAETWVRLLTGWQVSKQPANHWAA